MSGALIVNYLEQGVAASRPATPSAATTTLSFYYATDTGVLSFYDWNAAAWVNVTTNALVAPTLAGATLSPTAANNGQVILLNHLSGSVITLPAATGSGLTLQFIVSVAPTSNAHTITTVSNADGMLGSFIMVSGGAGAAGAWRALGVGDTDKISLNGTTTGGLGGDNIVLKDIAANLWSVEAQGSQVVASAATPFSFV